jgi:hypothetical protein
MPQQGSAPMGEEGSAPARAAKVVAGASSGASETMARVGRRSAATGADAVPRRAEHATPAVAPTGRAADGELAALPSWALAELFKVEGKVARVWVELVSVQMACNAETLQRLTTIRDWREAVAIHQEFTRDHLARVAEAVDRCLVLQHELVSRVVAVAGGEQGQQAA